MSETPAEYTVDRPEQPWRCGRGHILGIVQRCNNGANLLVFANAVSSLPADGPRIVAQLSGWAVVHCSVCGGSRAWEPGVEALERLVKSLQRNRKRRRPR
ncbi:MAG: hypothetical protein ACKOC5_12075 [Chloroflexota bacterium]